MKSLSLVQTATALAVDYSGSANENPQITDLIFRLISKIESLEIDDTHSFELRGYVLRHKTKCGVFVQQDEASGGYPSETTLMQSKIFKDYSEAMQYSSHFPEEKWKIFKFMISNNSEIIKIESVENADLNLAYAELEKAQTRVDEELTKIEGMKR